MDYPLWKNANFAFFLKPCLYCLQDLLFNDNVTKYFFWKRRKSFFYDLFSGSMTWEYRGLEGVTEGYNGLQGVKKG